MSNNYQVASPIDLRLPVTPEVQDPILQSELQKVYNALRQLQLFTTDQTGAIARQSDDWASLTPADTLKVQMLNRLYVQAAETLNFGDIVNYVASGSILQARKATAASATPRPGQGFCTQVGGIAVGTYGETQVGVGLCVGIAGMTVGSQYYLSTTAGLITATKPVAPNIIQPIGFALGTQALYFFGMPPV